MSEHFKTIYNSRAESYDQLVSREDYLGNITNALLTIRHVATSEVVEFGAGTGRLTRWFASQAKRTVAFELYPHMIEWLATRLEHPAIYAIADNHALPVASESADLVIEGWSFGHAISWYPDTWRDHIQHMLTEMRRIARPNGTMILIETLGTGFTVPTPPSEELAEFYAQLKETGFVRRWVRSDYRFESVEEAETLTRFFFGDELADRVHDYRLLIVPECTGIWWKHV
ncbi:MAG: class I SAM-dependent methyltransferase [Phototrophicales bacterium]|nr:class I SAM-dependent methyltransferase [Phototrophicales bacterium]